MRQKLSLITPGVGEFEKSLDFCENRLGRNKLVKRLEGLAFFDLGGIILTFLCQFCTRFMFRFSIEVLY